MRCQTFSFSFFPCSADHERDWPPCKVVFFGLATNALNVRNNNNNNNNSRRQINTGTKFEVSHLHNIFVDIGQSGPSSYQNNQYNNDEVLFLVRTVNEKVNPLRLQYSSIRSILFVL